MKKPKSTRMHLFKDASKTTDYTSSANSRHMIHYEFEHIQDSEANQSQYLLVEGPAEGRLKRYLHAKLERDCQALLDEFDPSKWGVFAKN